MRIRPCPVAERRETRHLFRCPACRSEVRLAAAWRKLPRRIEAAEPVSEAFLARVRAAVSRDRRRRLRQRALLSAAAAVLFFFLAGAGQGSRADETIRLDEAYARLLAPSALGSLLPD